MKGNFAAMIAQKMKTIKSEVPEWRRLSPWWEGFYAYMDGQPVEKMPTSEHRRGWWYAIKCKAAADVPVGCDDDVLWS